MAQRKRKGGATPPPARKIPIYIWVLLIALGGAIVVRVATTSGGGPHPDPRPGVTAEFVVDADRYASAPFISSTYTMAATIPNVLDGLFCYCDCAANFGHRSLLTCFESDHGAGCDVCLQEAAMAYRMTQDGASLDQIRAQIDATFARG